MAGGTPPNILLIVLDTTRADRLGLYGYPRPTSPNLDRLAARAVTFDQAIAQAAVTPVSHASIFTGKNPYAHGLRVLHGEAENRLGAEQRTLAEVLAESGYRTAAFVSAFPVTARFGLEQGFQLFEASFLDAGLEGEAPLVGEGGVVNTGAVQRRAGETTDLALDWLRGEGLAADQGGTDSPFFLWMHYFDPHDPRLLPPAAELDRLAGTGDFGTLTASPSIDQLELLRNLYDAEIAYMDHHVGRLLAALEAADQLDDTVVVVTADHGEGLGDHDWWTHGLLYQEQIRVPLLVRAPGWPEGLRIPALVRSIDLMPTLLELAGVAAERWPAMEGRGLVELVRPGSGPGEPRLAYSDSIARLTYTFQPAIVDRKEDVLFALVAGGFKYIHHAGRQGAHELYDLERDPREARNLAAARAQQVAAFQAELRRRPIAPRSMRADPGAGELSEEDRRRLEALGYVQ